VADLYRYGGTDAIYFKLTLSGVGINGPVVAGDMKISKDGGTPANVSALPTAVDGTNMVGVFKWVPTSAETSCKTFVINLKDAAGAAWDENCLIFITGGDTSAQLNGS